MEGIGQIMRRVPATTSRVMHVVEWTKLKQKGASFTSRSPSGAVGTEGILNYSSC